MQIPMVDLKAQYRSIGPEIREAIDRVLEHCGFILGKEVADFEAAFADYIGAAGAVGVASGTSALHLALHACGVGPGDEVITTAHTFIATAEPISHCGARPVFVDIDPQSFTIDPAAVEAAITKRTKAILPVHLYGHPADMSALAPIAAAHKLALIEDVAQAHGARQCGRTCGTLGDLACFSFFPGKNLGGYGDAGGVTGMDSELLARVRRLRDHGRTSKYLHEEVGYGERLDALQAAILGVKLRYLEEWTEARRNHASLYTELLDEAFGREQVTPPTEAAETRHVYHLYVIRARQRDALLAHLQSQGIGAGIHYPVPLHRQPAYCADYPGLSLPHTEQAAAEILSLPIHPEMTAAQIHYVIDQIKEFYA